MAKRPATRGKTKATPKRAARKAVAATSTTGNPSPAPSAGQSASPVQLAPPATGAPPRSDEDTIKRIDELIKNARTTWFALLGALVFAAITLAGVKDVAFFVSDVETELPLVGFSVPIVSFFWAAGLLTAALYIYFHLYLEQLWQELGDAPARIGADPKADPPDPGRPLADCIHPWLVSDTALRVRDWMRASPEEKPGSARGKFIDDVLDALTATAGYAEVLLIKLFRRMFGALAVVDLPTNEPRASRRRGMGWISNVVSVSLVWLFGLAVIAWFWWRSMPAHNPYLTFWLGAVLAMTIWVFFKSIDGSLSSLSGRARPEKWKPFFLAVFVAIVGLTTVRTWIDPWAGQPRENVFVAYRCDAVEVDAGKKFCWNHFELRVDFLRPAPANLQEVALTKKPPDWQGKEIMESEFRLRWCKETESSGCANPLAIQTDIFVNPLDVNAKDSRLANDSSSALFKENWRRRWKAVLTQLPKPDLRDTDFRAAILDRSSFEGINFESSRFDGASAIMVNFGGARLTSTSFRGTKLLATDFSDALVNGALFYASDLMSADFSGANLEGTIFAESELLGSNFGRARLRGTYISGKYDDKRKFMDFWLPITSEFEQVSDISFAAFRNSNFGGLDPHRLPGFDTTFADGSVLLNPGEERPDHWCKRLLSESEFLSRWRGWLEQEKALVIVPALDGHPPIPPGPC